MSFSRIIVRSLSTSSGSLQMVKTPVQVFGVDGRYASALYSAASKQKSLNVVEKDLIKLQDLMKKDKKVEEFIKNPSIKRKAKAEALKAVSGKVSLCSETANLLTLMAENGRLAELQNVINTFKMLMSTSRGEVNCEVTTAKPLDADMTSKLQAALKGFLSKDQSIMLTTKVDPTIIGGMIVSVGDKYIDLSISSKIKKYTDILTSTA